jgi:hypothetical protein
MSEDAPEAGKVGLDDFLAAGGTVESLIETADSSLPDLAEDEGVEYLATSHGLVWNKVTRDGVIPTTLTNFTAQIVREVEEDDGAEVRREYMLDAKLGGRTHRFRVPVAQFAGMNWASEHLGARALVYPGFTTKDRARFAIQVLSKDVTRQKVYGHTGWREIEGQWVYLHAGGAIGSTGPLPDIQVNVGDGLALYVLPEPPVEGLGSAVAASLKLLEVAHETTSYCLFAAIWRAVLGSCDFSLHLSGPTGVAKSELSSLVQRHFGPGMDARHLPASWSSTDNALEGLAFLAKDTILCIDDFAPTGTQNDVQQLHRKADRIFRAQGNHSGKGRMRADGTLRPPRPPRGLILSSGEDIPKGHSLRARLLVLEVEPGTVDFDRLTQAQQDASAGLYAQAMAGFVKWLAPQYETIRRDLVRKRDELRDWFSRNAKGEHRRNPTLFADLSLGFRNFLRYARHLGVLTHEEGGVLWVRCLEVFAQVSQAQSQHQAENEPTQRFLTLLSAALASGRAHVASLGGREPMNAERWGWRQKTYGGEEMTEIWTPLGDRVGWVHEDDLYLELDAAYAAAQRLARDSGDSLLINASTLKKRLFEKRLLVSVERRGNRVRYQVRKVVEGNRRELLHLHPRCLTAGTVSQVAQEDHSDEEDADLGEDTE